MTIFRECLLRFVRAVECSWRTLQVPVATAYKYLSFTLRGYYGRHTVYKLNIMDGKI